ncbi:NAD-dependent epimerase/dehydratase family protein [Actinomadura oligospora]|uniref:NAD-dependent epimerase/dehydratase family protein n=1 Tax=Actinomadura oligospora TaxID=111804 RepID=UPI0004B0EB55|nr:NAD(P)-dependent oxidoreductase [Actinomadura oligospora]
MTARSIVVLGASGFLGRHVHAALAAAGDRVTPVSRTTGEGLDLVRAGRDDLARLCRGADAVVNAAGAVWGGTEREMTELNTDLVGRLVDVLAGLPAPPRLVQLGSAYEYGPTLPGPPVGEDRPPAPESVYGRTKLAGTRTVVRAVEDGRLDATVLRVSVACGPGAPGVSLPGLVAAHLAAGGGDLRVAPLRAHRDLVDVRDVADAVVAAVDRPPHRAGPPGRDVTAAGTLINIGGGTAVPVRELVDLMIALSGVPVRLVEDAGPPPDGADPAGRTARSDARWQCLDIGRARRTLGWTPRRTLAESMRDLLLAEGAPVTGRPPAARAAAGRDRR